MIPTKTMILDCPNCSEDIRVITLCLNSPTNEYRLLDAEDVYECSGCEKTYLARIDIEEV